MASDARAELERETSRATEAMPELLHALADGDVARAYWLLRDYQERHELDKGFAGFAIFALSPRHA